MTLIGNRRPGFRADAEAPAEPAPGAAPPPAAERPRATLSDRALACLAT